MYPLYENELITFKTESGDWYWYKDRLAEFSLDELYKKQNELEKEISCAHAEEPPKKRSNKEAYRWWFDKTHTLISRLKDVRDEIIKRKSSGGNPPSFVSDSVKIRRL